MWVVVTLNQFDLNIHFLLVHNIISFEFRKLCNFFNQYMNVISNCEINIIMIMLIQKTFIFGEMF